MVFFTCNACGESLKKGQVEKHLNRCPNCQCLSCMDCAKDFWGDEYKDHVKCLSEDQKYGGKYYEAKTHKGDAKQQEWIQKVHEAIKKTSNHKVQEVLEQMSAYDNIPRKKRKFQNWMANSLKIHNTALQDQVWDIFSEVTKKENLENQSAKNEITPVASEENGIKTEKLKGKKSKKEAEGEKKNTKQSKKRKQQDQPGSLAFSKSGKSSGEVPEEDAVRVPPGNCLKMAKQPEAADAAQLHRNGSGPQCKAARPKAHGKKRKHGLAKEEDETPIPPKIRNCLEIEENSNRPQGKFNWKGTIRAVLKQAPDNELPVKKLRKKVIAQYYAIAGDHHKSEEEILALFNRKVSSNPKFRVLKEKVKLLK